MLLDLLYLFFGNLFYKIGIINEKNLDDIKFNFIEKSGIIFIKFVQILTSNSEYNQDVSDYLFTKMKYLQDKNKYDKIDLLSNIDYIDENPINIGSIANIYKIKYENKVCILKILVNNIECKIKNSFYNFKLYKNILCYIDYNLYNIFESIDSDEYYQMIINNIDFQKESLNLNKFRQIFNNYNCFIVPEIYTYCEKKIVMSYENGYKIDEIEKIFPELFEKALYLILSFLYLSFYHKIIHCDLHFSNFLFKVENNNIKMIILDFGMVKYINDKESELLLNIFDLTSENDFIEYLNEILEYYLEKNFNIKKYKHIQKNILQENNKQFFKIYHLIQIINLINFVYKKNDTIFSKLYFYMYNNNLIDI